MNSDRIKLFLTAEHPCSYLDDQIAQSLVVDPSLVVNRKLASRLADMGYRRSGSYYYQPQCKFCQQCKPARVLVSEFHPKRRFRRIINKNKDLSYRALESIDTDECYQLFERYINQRHQDGDMYPASRKNYQDFLCHDSEEQFYVGLYAENKLICVMVIDHFDNALSAVYTFFDPDENSRSLGIYAVLWQIERCKQLDYPWLYLGFWINNCQKMNYKSDYNPLEIREQDNWQLLEL